MSDYQTLLDQCHKPFKWYEHEMLQSKFIYVRIQDTVLRLNSLGVPWDFVQGKVKYTEEIVEKEDKKTKWYTASTEGQLTIEGLGSRGAPGAARGTDPDNAGKSAHSFALRKAGSLFGLSHYLMVRPQENTAFVQHMTAASLTDLADMKKAVTLMAKCDGLRTVDEILAHYGVTKDQLGTVPGITELLQQQGRI